MHESRNNIVHFGNHSIFKDQNIPRQDVPVLHGVIVHLQGKAAGGWAKSQRIQTDLSAGFEGQRGRGRRFHEILLTVLMNSIQSARISQAKTSAIPRSD
jgi:hypothetical protein